VHAYDRAHVLGARADLDDLRSVAQRRGREDRHAVRLGQPLDLDPVGHVDHEGLVDVGRDAGLEERARLLEVREAALRLDHDRVNHADEVMVVVHQLDAPAGELVLVLCHAVVIGDLRGALEAGDDAEVAVDPLLLGDLLVVQAHGELHDV